jgi:hypothetical protein
MARRTRRKTWTFEGAIAAERHEAARQEGRLWYACRRPKTIAVYASECREYIERIAKRRGWVAVDQETYRAWEAEIDAAIAAARAQAEAVA